MQDRVGRCPCELPRLRGPLSWRAVALLGLALSLVTACDARQALKLDYRDPLATGDGQQGGGDHHVVPPAGDPVPPSDPTGVEVCDGWDNDGNGFVDENTGGGPCTTANGGEGTERCVNANLVCWECEPGDSQSLPCACGLNHVDVCNSDGVWQVGACGGCTAEPTGCGSAHACRPDPLNPTLPVYEYRRCDLCAPGQPCGSPCLASKWRCNPTNCEWVKIEECAAREAQCDQDMTRPPEDCGFCGQRDFTCDGCFWVPTDCEAQGACAAGTTGLAGCAGHSCEDGWYTTQTCDSACQWDKPQTCSGCKPGIWDVTEQCVAGYACCGIKITRVQCDAQTVTLCDGSQLVIGIPRSAVVIRNDCVNNACTPGQPTGTDCHTGLGECGTATAICNDCCQWGTPGDCVADPESCVPFTPKPYVCPDACGTTVTVTCLANGCGYSSPVGCGVCNPATDSDSVPCGHCGTAPVPCKSNCQWGSPGTCVDGGRCTPGSTTRDCGCGNTTTDTCDAWGCSMSYGTCPTQQCQPTDHTDVPCGACGTARVDCTSHCQWGTPGTCTEHPVCTASANMGQVSCGCGNYVTEWCDSDGCGTHTDACPSVECTGGSQTVGCGTCGWGTKTRYCVDCAWGDYGACSGGEGCQGSQPADHNCGGCSGTVPYTCNGCSWVLSGTCPPDPCAGCAGQGYPCNGINKKTCSCASCSCECVTENCG